MNNKRIIKKEMRDSVSIKDRSKLKKRLAIVGAIIFAVLYVVVLSYDFKKEEQITSSSAIPEKIEEPKDNQAETPNDGGQLRISVSKFSSVNPYKNEGKTMDDFFRLLYDSLFELDGKYDLVGELASGYTIGEGGKNIIVSLKGDAKWHDGSRVTGEDVVFTFNQIKSNPQSPYYALISNISKVSSAGSTVVFETGQPNALEVNNLIFPIITSKSVGKTSGLTDGVFGVIGNGRFVVSEYNKGKNIRLRKNENYYGTKAHINEIDVKIYSDNTIEKNMFVSSATDVIHSDYYDLNKYNFDIFRISSYQSRKFDFIAFNTAKAPFDQSANRRAFTKIMDMESIILDAYRKELQSSYIPINQGSKYNLLKLEPFDKEDVKKNKWINPIPNRITIITDKTDPMKHRLAYMIKGQLSLVGMDSVVLGLSREELLAAVETGSFNIGVFSYDSPINKDITKLLKNNQKLFNYDISKIVQMMSNVYVKHSLESLLQSYEKVQVELLKDIPFLGVGFRNDYNIYNKRVHGNLESTDIEFYRGIENLFIVEELTPKAK